jgi:hypothetical protein
VAAKLAAVAAVIAEPNHRRSLVGETQNPRRVSANIEHRTRDAHRADFRRAPPARSGGATKSIPIQGMRHLHGCRDRRWTSGRPETGGGRAFFGAGRQKAVLLRHGRVRGGHATPGRAVGAAP